MIMCLQKERVTRYDKGAATDVPFPWWDDRKRHISLQFVGSQNTETRHKNYEALALPFLANWSVLIVILAEWEWLFWQGRSVDSELLKIFC